MGETGFAGLTFPEASGHGLPSSYLRAFNAGVASYYLSSMGQWVLVLGMHAPALLEPGTEEQQRYYLAECVAQ
jgi:alkylation response protein AidB-like acyl-CoA dehydrogenase